MYRTILAFCLLIASSTASLALDVDISQAPYYAIGNGQDMSAAFASAIADVSAAGGGKITIPPADSGSYYYFAKPLYLRSGITLWFTDTSTPIKFAYNISDSDRLNGYEFTVGNISQGTASDHDIKIHGGIWDLNAYNNGTGDPQYNSQRKIFANGAYNMGFQFVKVSNITVENLTIKSARNWALVFNQTTGAVVNEITFDNWMSGPADNQDGCHFVGENSNATVTNLRGHTNDDMIAITTGECPLGPRFKMGDVDNITVDGVYPAGSLTCARIAPTGSGYINNITIRNVSGTVSGWRGFNIETYNTFMNWGHFGKAHIGNVTIENFNLTSDPGQYFMSVEGYVEKLTLKNITKPSANGQPLIAVLENAAAGSLGEINELILDGVTTGTNTVPLINNQGIIKTLTVKNWNGVGSVFASYSNRTGTPAEIINVYDNSGFAAKTSFGTGRSVTVNSLSSSNTYPDLTIVYPLIRDPMKNQYSVGSITLSGTVTSGSSVTVGGSVATVTGANWSKTVSLSAGMNSISVAASLGGQTITKAASAYYNSGNQPPGAPTNLSYDGTTLSWTAPTDPEGNGPLTYRIWYSSADGRSDGRNTWGVGGVALPGPPLQNWITTPSANRYPNSSTTFSGTSATMTGLVTGAWYDVTVSAVDSLGNESKYADYYYIKVGTSGVIPAPATRITFTRSGQRLQIMRGGQRVRLTR